MTRPPTSIPSRSRTPPGPAFHVALFALALAGGCRDHAVMSNGGGANAHTGGPAFAVPGAGDAGPGTGSAVPAPAAAPERFCAESVTRAVQAPVDLLVLVGSSITMNIPVEPVIPGFPPMITPGSRSKFFQATQALQLFARDPRSAGLGMGLQFFPSAGKPEPCSVDTDCNGSRCLFHSFCVGPTLRTYAYSLTACDPAQPACPAGSTCKPGGLCALNPSISCPVDGQPCNIDRGLFNPNRANPEITRDDVCRAIPTGKYCFPRTHSCDPGDYEHPLIPIFELPGNEKLVSGALEGRVTNFSASAVLQAVKGGLAHLRTRQVSHPDRKPVLLLVTDHFDNFGCSSNDVPTIAAELAAARMGTPSIPTYVIGVLEGNGGHLTRPIMNILATAGGTGAPIFILDNADVTDQLHTALADVRTSTAPCEFPIPPATGGKIDYAKVKMRWKGTATPEQTVPYVESADRCDPMGGGWHYDVRPMGGMPSQVIACEASCRQFKGDTGGSVRLAFGCATIE
jgi:hypothetical protein